MFSSSSQHISDSARPTVWSCPFTDDGHWQKELLRLKRRWWWWWRRRWWWRAPGVVWCNGWVTVHPANCHFSSTCMFSFHVPLQMINKLYSEEYSAVRIFARFLTDCIDLHSSSRAGSCVCVWIQLGAAMSSAELPEPPVVPKEERLYFGGRLETRRRPRTASRLTLRDGRALTLALEWPGETFR